MIIYFLIFSIVIFFCLFAQVSYKKNKKISYLFSFLAIIIISLFAACRGLTVGTDVKVYGIDYFNQALSYNNFFHYIKIVDGEYLYYILNFLISRFTTNIHVLFFFIEFIITFLVFKIAYNEKERGTFWICILTFLLIWFNSSLNVLRQSIAIFIVLYAFKYIEEKKYNKYLFFILLAFCFHRTAIICFLVPLLDKISVSKNKKIYTFLVILIIFLAYGFLEYGIYIIDNFLPFLSKYTYYLNMAGREPNINWHFAIFKFLMLIGVLFFSKKVENKNSNNLLIILSILDLVLYCSSAFVRYGYRSSYFFLVHYIFLLPRIDWSLKDSSNRVFYRIFIIISLLLYWYFRFVVVGYDGTIPYVFYWN